MRKIRFILAVWACKILIAVGKLTGKKSSATPGVYAYKICPDILRILSKKVSKGIIAVCGTNGKTTTNNIIDKILKDKGFSVVCNNVGANMLSGVVTAFIEKADFLGRLKCDYASLEMDEAFSVKIFEHLTPDIVVITNLFRDQLDRYGEVEITAEYLKKALAMAPDATLIVNGDDPNLSGIAKTHRKFLTFGVCEKVCEDGGDAAQLCPVCGGKIKYNYQHYSQLGDWSCESCENKRPDVDFSAKDVDLTDGLKFRVNNNLEINVDYRGFYNIYNILAALMAVDKVGVDLNGINGILSDYKPQIGRMEKFNLEKTVILNLAKNPAGFNQAINTVLSDKRKKDIIIAVNDCESDGMDISWLWDVDFEKFADNSIGNIGLCGMRGKELDLRFKYADVNKETKVYGTIGEAISGALSGKGEVLYVLVNYTVIFEAQKILKELEGGNK